jgi:hypothetical protein
LALAISFPDPPALEQAATNKTKKWLSQRIVVIL